MEGNIVLVDLGTRTNKTLMFQTDVKDVREARPIHNSPLICQPRLGARAASGMGGMEALSGYEVCST